MSRYCIDCGKDETVGLFKDGGRCQACSNAYFASPAFAEMRRAMAEAFQGSDDRPFTVPDQIAQ